MAMPISMRYGLKSRMMLDAVVPVANTLTTFTGKNPLAKDEKVTVSPPAVVTRKSPPVPTYNVEGANVVELLGVTAAARSG